jgi:cellulose synthase/poly-beta-1,6-N-acetylglucosamine synthase-like glycosyltransferase
METDMKAQFLKKATEAFEAEKKAAVACQEHAKSCYICRSKILSFFIRCLTMEGLLFDHITARTDADQYRSEINNLLREETPSVDWLENLYRLPDDRVGKW